ncbi:MAG: hypothetical protein CFE32_19300, partial [Alphaproteobacteria bacterium PA3]
MNTTRHMRFGALLLALTLPLVPLAAQTAPVEVAVPSGEAGLAPVRTETAKGRILLTLPRPAEDGVALRVLYTTALRTGLGSAPLVLDRGKTG